MGRSSQVSSPTLSMVVCLRLVLVLHELRPERFLLRLQKLVLLVELIMEVPLRDIIDQRARPDEWALHEGRRTS